MSSAPLDVSNQSNAPLDLFPVLVVTSKTSQVPPLAVFANHGVTFMQLLVFVLATANAAQVNAGHGDSQSR